MKEKINDVYNICEDWTADEIRRLISELEILAGEKEEYEEEKGL